MRLLFMYVVTLCPHVVNSYESRLIVDFSSKHIAATITIFPQDTMPYLSLRFEDLRLGQFPGYLCPRGKVAVRFVNISMFVTSLSSYPKTSTQTI